MPFALVSASPGAPLPPAVDPRRVAGELLASLPERLAGLAGVIGPTTTEAYADRPDPAAVLAAERGVAYVVNGRLLATAEGPRLLVEVIRTSDGVHVWVRRYPLDAPAAEVAGAVAEGLLAELAAATARPTGSAGLAAGAVQGQLAKARVSCRGANGVPTGLV